MSKTSSSLALSQGAIDRDKATDGAASPRPPAPIGALPAIQPEILQLLLEGPPAYVADTNGRVIFANPTFRELLHRLGGGSDLDGAAHVFPLHDVLADALATNGPVYREDVHNVGKKVLYLTSEHRPLHDAAGRIVAVGGLFHDSSREASAALEASAARGRFHDLARLVSDWLWETDAHFNLTFVSARAMEILGLHPRHMIGRKLFSLGAFRGVDTGKVPTENTRSPFRNLLFEMSSATGGLCLFQLSGIPVFDEERGTFLGFRGTARDITAEAKAQEDADRSQRRLAAAIENISEGFALWGREQRLVTINPRFCAMFARERPAVEGMTFDEFIAHIEGAGLFADGDDAARWRDARRQVLESDDGTATVRMADGRWFNISEHRTGVRRAIVTIVTDITEMKAREEALLSAKNMAEVANRSKGEFLANMSHELRTPLNAIIGFSEIMERGTFGPLGSERYTGYVRDIIHSSRHLLAIINDILEAAKMEAGKLDLDEEEIDVADEVESTVHLLAEQAKQAQLTIAVETAEALPRLFADPRRLRQILLNLLSNAIKFTPPDGRVTVRLGLAPSGGIALAVADTGIGIAPEDMPKVLAPFGQVEGSLNRRHDGTGLGLPLTKALTELHGGEFAIDSARGKGTRITVSFPPARTRPAPGVIAR